MIDTSTRTAALSALLLALAALAPAAAQAQDCAADKPAAELSADEVDAIYACIFEALAAGYASGDNEVAKVYRDWTVTAVRPAAPGFHGERLLLTFANDIGAAEYLKFAEEGVNMPVGSILAKESIGLKDGKAVPGPLFIMTKVAAGQAPDTNDWVYDGVQPNGAKMNFPQKFCHDCHLGFEDRDYLGYPVEDVRVSN